MTGKKSLFWLLLLCLPCTGFSATSAEFLQSYTMENTQVGDAEKLEKAFDAYVAFSSQTSQVSQQDRYAQQQGYARYFAFVGKSQPQLWRMIERRFKQSNWTEKQALLAICSRGKDDQLKANLRQWALLEEDNDRAVLIQQAARPSPPLLSILENPARTKSDLAEQWSCFFASGNTQVVQASIALLGNTVLGYCERKGVDGKLIRELYPRERRLRKKGWNLLAARAYRYPELQSALLQSPWLTSSDDGQQLAERMLMQAFDQQNTVVAREILPMISFESAENYKRIFYHGALAQLERNHRVVLNTLKKLEKVNRLWAERLRGYRAFVLQKQLESDSRATAVSAGGKQVTLMTSQILSDAKRIATYEVWDIKERNHNERSDVFYSKRLAAMDSGASRHFYMILQSEPEIAWVLNQDQTFRWSAVAKQWTSVENRIIRTQIEDVLGIEIVRNFLVQQTPHKSFQVEGVEGERYAGFFYRQPKESLLLDAVMDNAFRDSKLTIQEVQLFIDLENHQLLRMRIQLDLFRGGTKHASGVIEKVFYDYGDTELNWMRDID